jgi:hypothetical protein
MTETPPSSPPPGYGAPQQQGYAAPPPGYGGYGPPQPKNGLGTAALVLGILGLVFFWTIFGGFILGLLGLIFGIIGRKRASRGEATNGGSALAGAICGGIAVVATIAIIAAGAAFFSNHKDDFNNYSDCLNNASTNQEIQQCADDFNRSINN